MITIGSQRHLFDIPTDVAYFNTAYNAPQLNASRDALVAAAGAKSHPWTCVPDDFFANAETVRRLAATLFGGDADGYAVIPSASYGISSAARAIEPTLKRGDRIILLDDEFPSNVLPWQRAATERGAVIVTVPTPGDLDWTPAILAEISHGASVVALSHCHWTNGAVIDIHALAGACHAAGAALVLDATQSLGALTLDFSIVQPDFVVAAGYKWLLCPYGVGLMYVAPRWRDSRPLEESWLARNGAEDFTSLMHYADAYAAGARRFDVGEKCTAQLPGAIAALQQLHAWGIPAITESLAAVNVRIAELLSEAGFRLPPPQRRSPHMLGAGIPGNLSRDFVGALRRQNVFVSQRGASVRFAPHLHVTGDDIERLASALTSLRPE